MDYARLGNTGLMVSELCLGCMTFGQEADKEASREIVGRFLEAGGNFVDTADVYSDGVSEEITGRALEGVRDDVVLATKVRFPMGWARTTSASHAQRRPVRPMRPRQSSGREGQGLGPRRQRAARPRRRQEPGGGSR